MPVVKDAARLAAHVDLIVKRYGIVVEWSNTARGRAWSQLFRIEIRPVASQITYFIAMHEIGHCLTYEEGQSLIEKEALAWEWAFDNAIVAPNPATLARCAKYFSSYMAPANLNGLSERYEGVFLDVSRRMRVDVDQVSKNLEARKRAARERKVADIGLLAVYKVGEVLRTNDRITPAYMRGLLVRVVDKKRKTIVVVEILEETGSSRFRKGEKVRVPPSALVRL